MRAHCFTGQTRSEGVIEFARGIAGLRATRPVFNGFYVVIFHYKIEIKDCLIWNKAGWSPAKNGKITAQTRTTPSVVIFQFGLKKTGWLLFTAHELALAYSMPALSRRRQRMVWKVCAWPLVLHTGNDTWRYRME